ncbi:MAG TPA: hypothetical protein PLO93_06215 [Candidatus Omnitrophota bacterium]|nr:hypothetical protein [Candidatus Omnitrophota bacterium]HQL41866.1 hypothetical protein [Candidatus Omnitrophota bacterium]
MRRTKGQSAVEYILLAACFIAFLIVFLSPNGPMKNTIELNINRSVNQIGAMVNATDFASGLIPDPAGGGTPPPVNCAQYSSNEAACCGQSQCLWREYYHLNNVTTSCISKSSASSSCDSYNLNSCCCVKEVGYSGGGPIPVCPQ